MAKKILISQAAEAKIFSNKNKIIKERTKKSYRLPILDEKLRKQRTKKEAKLLEKLQSIIPVPKIIHSSNYEITMQKIQGKKLSESLDKLKNSSETCKEIGKNIAKLHDEGIIHGDLTTSNMILSNKTRQRSRPISSNSVGQAGGEESPQVVFIDFGLSFHSNKIEDKAVDLHLIKQALEAKHYKHAEKFFAQVLKGYKSSKNFSLVIKQLEKVERRGRYKAQY